MNHATTMGGRRGPRQSAGEDFLGLLIGAGFTFALFLGLARFEHFGAAQPVAAIEDLRIAAIPFDPPPPPPRPVEQVPEADVPLAGLEIAASDSPVSVAVVPPDLERLMSTSPTLPRAKVQFGALPAELKPKLDTSFDVRHVYQESEVDQKPHSLVRTVPPIPPEVRGAAPTLRVEVLLLIGVDGRAENVRVVGSSGNARFDAIVADTVRDEWVFSPGLRRGKKVRVLAHQAVRVNFNGSGSPFDVK